MRRSAQILEIPANRRARARRQRARHPRIANRLLRRVRDYAQVGRWRHHRAIADAAMAMLKVDPEGFDQLDRRMLTMIIESFDGGPVGTESPPRR